MTMAPVKKGPTAGADWAELASSREESFGMERLSPPRAALGNQQLFCPAFQIRGLAAAIAPGDWRQNRSKDNTGRKSQMEDLAELFEW
jgi:hypothetical protein